jgi:hypothetical protein
LYLETKLEELEDTMKQDCEKISSLQNIVRTVEQRNLLGDRPVVGISGNNIDVANSANGASVCISGTHQYHNETKVTFRSKEVWIRPKKTFFSQHEHFFPGKYIGYPQRCRLLPVIVLYLPNCQFTFASIY